MGAMLVVRGISRPKRVLANTARRPSTSRLTGRVLDDTKRESWVGPRSLPRRKRPVVEPSSDSVWCLRSDIEIDQGRASCLGAGHRDRRVVVGRTNNEPPATRIRDMPVIQCSVALPKRFRRSIVLHPGSALPVTTEAVRAVSWSHLGGGRESDYPTVKSAIMPLAMCGSAPGTTGSPVSTSNPPTGM